MIFQRVDQRPPRALEQNRRLALAEFRHERLAMFAQAVFRHLAEVRMPAGRAMRRHDDEQMLFARRAQVPQPPFRQPAAVDAAPRENHVELVTPELLQCHTHVLSSRARQRRAWRSSWIASSLRSSQ